MSYKAFYQTFYQTEQLFRRADDVLTFPPLEPETVVAVEAVATPVVQPVAILVPPVIGDPVLPTPPPIERAAEPHPAPLPDVPVSAPTLIKPVISEELVSEPDRLVAKAQDTPTAPANTTSVERTPRRPATPMLSQKVLILVDEDLLPSELLFLEKILKAVNLDITGVDLLNIHGTKTINFAEVLSGKYIHHFFTFGVPFTRLDLDILMDRYHPVRFDGITFLLAYPLPAIEADVALKKKLWEALKKIFLWQ